MKAVKITYHCDYCGGVINTDDDVICVLHPGRIGYQDSLIMQPEDEVQHYHDYCMEYLLCLKVSNDKNRKSQNEPVADPEQEEIEEPKKEKYKPHEGGYLGPVVRGRKDLPALNAMFEAGRTYKWCAEEFDVAVSTIANWKKEIFEMKEAGTWEAYCEEMRAKE